MDTVLKTLDLDEHESEVSAFYGRLSFSRVSKVLWQYNKPGKISKAYCHGNTVSFELQSFIPDDM